MTTIADIVAAMRSNPEGVRFRDLNRVCAHYFGASRQHGSSHQVYRTPWPDDPRVNIQNDKGMAKAYQVLKAIEKLEAESGNAA